MKKFYLPVLLLLSCQFSNAQNWLRDMYNPWVNFFTVQREFNDWWKIHSHEILSDNAHGEKEHGEAWRIFKRWEHDMTPMMLSMKGNRLGTFNQAEAGYYARNKAQSNLRGAADWGYIGNQISFDDGQGDSSTGRINCVRFDPNNPATIYCGAPSGGLWKSADFGHTWQLLNTDNLAQIGVSDIAINPQNSNTIYIATGDIANSACISVGVLKSVDGGLTWDTTGLSWTVSQGFLIARLLMSPLDSNTLIAATNAGVFKTSDGGHTWGQDSSIYGLTGMEFNPANPQTIYACGYQLYKSVDGAATWKQLSNGLPDTITSGGFGIGLTAADTSCVYVLVTDTPQAGAYYVPFNGIYQSLDAGNSFQLQSSNPDPSGTGTQGLYDLTIAVSPVNRNQLVMGAVRNAFSSDGGVTWTLPGFDSHVDHHDIRFYPGSADTVFNADDGGLFISTDAGNTWAGLNNGIHIGQLYNVSSASQTKYLYLTARQDEGTLLQDTDYAAIVNGGDGLECLIDPTNQNNMYFSSEYGDISNSQDGGLSANYIAGNWSTGVNGMGSWNTPYALDPNNDQVLYVAKDYVYKSPDGGNSWSALNTPPLDTTNYYTEYYIMLAVAPTNNQYIYAGTYYKLYRSSDGGNTFTDISAGLDTPFYCMAVSESNPQEIWVGTSYAHIFKSLNAGANWSDFSTGLPVGSFFSPQTIAPVKGGLDALYTGLYYAGGVYYRDSTMNQWMPYSTGLPNVTVSQIEVDYCANKIRAATYGRDLWESDPYLPLLIRPVASANYAITTGQCTDTVQFLDNSYYNPTGWQWYFPGGQPASSTSENPTVVYPGGGNFYNATFIVSNSTGSDTVQYSIATDICTGINQINANSSLQIMPNPNNGNFVISLNSPPRGKITFSVFDNVGQNVYQFATIKSADVLSNEFALSNLSNGIYFLQVLCEGNNTVQKLVVGN